jgi:hypothetical protein
MSQTNHFGAPVELGRHHFYVIIPADSSLAIRIVEDYGYEGDDQRGGVTVVRVILARQLWAKIRDVARRDFNDRLKAKKQGTGSWNTGTVRMDRFLGRELCVLAWAAEHATPDECRIIAQKWLALRPEERWWLYSKTSSEAGLADQMNKGWRKALYCALSDGSAIQVGPKISPKVKKQEEQENMRLFDLMKGNV